MSTSSIALLDEAASKTLPNLVTAAIRLFMAGKSPLKAALAARLVNALAQLITQLDERSLGNASAAPSDYDALLEILEDPVALDLLRREDALAPARLRGIRAKQQLLEAEGGSISVEQVASLLHLTRQAVDKRRRAGRLIGLDLGRHGYAYPVWQFGASGTLPGLEQVLAELGDHDPWMQVIFMLSPNPRLNDQTPLAELRRGYIQEVSRAARAYAEQGAD